MFAHSLSIAIGTAAVVSALSDSSLPATVVTRDIYVNIATATASVAHSNDTSNKIRELDTRQNIHTSSSTTASTAATSILPSEREQFFIHYFENRTSGLEVDNKVEAYVSWLLEPGFAAPSASAGDKVRLLSSGHGEFFPDLDETPGELFPELSPPKQKGPEKILPGTCEFKLRKLMRDGLQPAFDLYVKRAGEKRHVEDEKVNRANRDLLSLEGDELWLLRYYIRCCPRNSGRGAYKRTLAKEEDPGLTPPPQVNNMTHMSKRDETKPLASTGPDPDKLPGSDYDPTKPLHDKDLEVNTPCDQKLIHYQQWTNTYLSWAGEMDRFIKEELPKLKPLKDYTGYQLRLDQAYKKRDRIVKGLARCCKDSPQPGPPPIGGHPFPSVPQEKPFVREL